MNASKTVVGIDIAKRVFQLHSIDMETGEIVSLQLKREKFLEHFANRQPCLIGMEACGGAQHWARRLTVMGHQVKLLPGKAVKGFMTGNKNDRQDARAIWTAVQQPHVKAVAVKTEEQQAILALHRMRSQLVKFRTAQINGLRGLLTEYGEVMPQGKAGVRKGISEALARLQDRLPAMVIETLREQWARIGKMDEEIATVEQRIKRWLKQDDACRRIVRIPPHLDSDSSGNWTAISRLTGQLNRVASGMLIVLDPVDGWKGLRVWFGSGCRVMHRRPTARL